MRRRSNESDCKECAKLRTRVRELEHEVERLTRKVARERKNKGREQAPPDDDEETSAPASVAKNGCPRCGSETKDFPTAYKTLRICTNKLCLWRVVS